MSLVAANKNEICPVVVGTGGHVDHGKTSLVRHLTGRNTDTLREEQERGLTINLGFAPCRLPNGSTVGVIDVPGHADFLRNMIAGIAAVEVFILVVAADDGVMPQTVEHLQIARHLAAPLVLVVISKIDLVDPELLELAQMEVRELLAANKITNQTTEVPIVPFSNATREGFAEVMGELSHLVAISAAPKTQRDERAFRMPVLRVFSKKGSGTVVAGVPISGCVKSGATVERLPVAGSAASSSREAGVVRGVQSYGVAVEQARARVCCALNLRDIDYQTTTRGMVIAQPGVYAATDTVFVRVQNTHPSLNIKTRLAVRLHSGSASVLARLRWLGTKMLSPGDTAFAQVQCQAPLVVAAGDRVLLRQLSPARTLGGGVIISAQPQTFRRVPEEFIARLRQANEAVEAGDLISAEIFASPQAFLSREVLARFSQRESALAKAEIKRLEDSEVILPLSEDWWIVAQRAAEVAEKIRALLTKFHADNPYLPGLDAGRIGGALGIPERVFKPLMKIIQRARGFVVRDGVVALARFAQEIDGKFLARREALLAWVTAAGKKSAPYQATANELGLKPAEMKKVLHSLTVAGVVTNVQNCTVVHGSLILTCVIDECREVCIELAKEAASGAITLQTFRERSALGRNLAVAILESFDAEEFTRREGDARRLVDAKEPEKNIVMGK